MSRNAKVNTLLLLLVAALAVLPLALGLGDHKEQPFSGSDSEAETAITELQPDYKPWFSPLYEPPSGEIESALFALQAALGAGVLAYYFGLRRGRRQGAAKAAEAAGAKGAAAEDDPVGGGDSDTARGGPESGAASGGSRFVVGGAGVPGADDGSVPFDGTGA
ncbi:energy-coupling factor ABC transporter substrate-binding protein [Streptomyces sp. NPDC006197]|uniref:energy-coupling factor ABC transporter substrate-binding protein n=1 Tax=Streptomyces sp. NPDC006197 TaxID=3156685 RepID=UPI0033A496C8